MASLSKFTRKLTRLTACRDRCKLEPIVVEMESDGRVLHVRNLGRRHRFTLTWEEVYQYCVSREIACLRAAKKKGKGNAGK